MAGRAPRTPHYFSPEPAVPSRPGTVELVLPDLRLTLATDRGVFSPGAVDPGTRFLLLDGPRPAPDERGPLLDLGCGYGPVACALAARAPEAEVWAVDVNARARELCRRNAPATVRVAAPEEVPANLRFRGIWSNPPIRIGKAALHALLAGWLGRLAPGGRAWLVVHKHLGSDSLARWLDATVGPTVRLASSGGYRILEVAGPEEAPS